MMTTKKPTVRSVLNTQRSLAWVEYERAKTERVALEKQLADAIGSELMWGAQLAQIDAVLKELPEEPRGMGAFVQHAEQQ